MQGQREAMCEALDVWFRSNVEQHFSTEVRPQDPVNYDRVVASSMEGKGWSLQVEGTAGDAEFQGDFLLKRDEATSSFVAKCIKMVRMDTARRKNTAEKASEEVHHKSDVCDSEKVLRAAHSYSHISGERNAMVRKASGFGEQLAQWYNAKQGDLLDELCNNLRLPTGCDAMSRLAGLACALKTDHSQSDLYGSFNLMELIVLRGYTQRPFDIDRDMGWPDAPPAESAYEDSGVTEKRSRYESAYNSWMWDKTRPDGSAYRNGSLYAAVCSALRDQGPGGSSSQWSEDLITKWIKWICTLSAITATDTPCKDALWRGLGGGGLSREVVESHADLERNALLVWPAASSASYNYNTSKSYALGKAVNSKSKPTKERPGTIMFTIKGVLGLPLQSISQYPKEEEVLISPLSIFTVKAVSPDPANTFGCGLDVELECMGPLGAPAHETPWLRRFYEKVRGDSGDASERLSKHIVSLSLQQKWKKSTKGRGWDVVVRSMRDQMSSERDRLVAKAKENEDEVKDLRKKAAESAKWKRQYELECAEHEALRQEMQQEADQRATQKLDVKGEMHMLQQKIQKLEGDLGRAQRELESVSRDSQQDRRDRLEQTKKVEEERDRKDELEIVHKARVSSMEKEIADLMTACRGYAQEVVQWKDRCRESQSSVDEAVRKADQQHGNVIRSLRGDIKDLRALLQEDRLTRDDLQTELDRTKQTASSKTDEAERLRQRLEDERRKHKEELSSLHAQCRDAERTGEELKAIRASEMKEVDRLKGLLERESRVLREVRKASDDAEARLSREVSRLKDSLREEILQKKKASAENKRCRDLLEEEKQGRAELRHKHDALKTRVQEAGDAHKEEALQLQHRINLLREDAQETELRFKREEISLQENIAKAESQLKALDEKWKRQQQQESSAASHLRLRLEDSITTSHAEVEQLKQALAREKAELDRQDSLHTTDIDQYKALLRKAERSSEEVGSQLKEEQRRSLQRNLQLEEERRRVAKLESGLSESQGRAESMEARMRKAEQEVVGLRGDIDKVERERSRLEEQHREQVQRMNLQMGGLRETVQQHQTRANEERRANSELREEASKCKADRDVSQRLAETHAFNAAHYKDSYDRAMASPPPLEASSPSPSRASVSPLRMHADASPALRRIEATTRRLRREVDSIRSVVPPSLSR